MQSVPQSWIDLKRIVSEVVDLLGRAPTLPGEVRQEELLRLLSLIDVAILSLPETTPEHWDDVEVARGSHRDEVCKAFPEFGFYNFVRPDTLGEADVLPGVNDAVDDLDEILSEVDQAFKHEDLVGWQRAVWEIRESYGIHFGSHLVDLRAYIYRLRFPAP